ncbi:serine/threonine-protein kinase [Pyxidicoccus sp. MSG2]|uniref:serine/threonine protein kinase n=1 Tax=Pyxidicoccus sp. MSG2 TaxID=2996790 RepID=UPI002D1E429E|nr:serine/threonine-protein kinase [Pyxidicoccus sp. MSG2]
MLERRGRGNYGTVYRVESADGSGPFALKLATHPMDPRFDREAELLSRIHHSGVPRLHAHGLWPHPAGPFPFLVMEWVEGQPLYDWGEEQHPTSRQVLRLLAQVARALDATHSVEAVHRDVKGDNVLVRVSDGQAILTDFGAGHFRGAPTLTAPPLPPGTPPYRSPEAVRFQWGYRSHPTAHYAAQPADDVFALGVTAYRLVTGTYPPPPRGTDTHEGDVEPLTPPRLRNPAVCEELDALILHMLADPPEERLGGGSAAAVARSLEEAMRTAGSQADLPLSVPVARPDVKRAGHEPAWVRTGEGAAHAQDAGHVPSRSDTPVIELAPAPSPHDEGRWPGLAVATVVVSLLSAATGWFLRPTHEASPMAQASSPQEARDGGTVAVGDAAVTSPVSILAPVPSFSLPPGLSLPMPDRPFPGQRKPPCNRKGEVELRGGCWYELARVKSPCDEDAYDYKGACYLPSFPVQRPHTSAPATQPNP